MNEMIERVSKAICCPTGCQEGTGHPYCEPHRFEAQARAAIEAMLVPDPAMITFTLAHTGNPTPEQSNIGKDAIAADAHPLAHGIAAEIVEDWQAMITAALAQPESGR